MKRQFKLIGITLVACSIIISCQRDELDGMIESESENQKSGGIINAYDNTMVITWNEALSSLVDNKMPPPMEARMYALVSLAVHDALNNVIPVYETYALDNATVGRLDLPKKHLSSIAEASIAQSAHDMLVALMPASDDYVGDLLAQSLSEIEESEYKALGIEIGIKAAASVLAKRSNDPPLQFQSYVQGTEVGQYQSPMPYLIANPPIWPANAAYAPDFGSFSPLGILSSSQFRAKPPYTIGSAEYAADYNEVKILGSNNSTVRTPEQTEIGVFFIDNVSNSINRVAKVMAMKEKLNGWETARLMALVHMSQFDACLSSFEGKYHYNLWRPITAIVNGDADGNDHTVGDASWMILQAARFTPPTPTYPSTHSEMGGSGAEMLKLFFKKDNKSFTIGSYNLPNVQRSFLSFSHFSTECALSRIYIGYHFRNDVIEGEKMGRHVAQFVFKNNLRRLN